MKKIVIALLVLAFAGSAHAQDLKNLTVKIGVAADQTQGHQKFSSFEDEASGSENHSAKLRSFAAEYKINSNWIVSGRFEAGSIKDDDRFKSGQLYSGTDHDVAVRVERFWTDQGWVHLGYVRLDDSVDISESVPEYGEHPVIMINEFAGYYGAAPIVGTSLMQMGVKNTYQAIEFGFGGRNTYKKSFYQMDLEAYPLASAQFYSTTSYNHGKTVGGSTGGQVYGWRIGGSLGYLLYKGLGVEGNFRFVNFYGPNDLSMKQTYGRFKTGLNAVVKF